jgi:hypothetical protein
MDTMILYRRNDWTDTGPMPVVDGDWLARAAMDEAWIAALDRALDRCSVPLGDTRRLLMRRAFREGLDHRPSMTVACWADASRVAFNMLRTGIQYARRALGAREVSEAYAPQRAFGALHQALCSTPMPDEDRLRLMAELGDQLLQDYPDLVENVHTHSPRPGSIP